METQPVSMLTCAFFVAEGVPRWSWADSDSLSPSWQPRSTELELVSYVLLSLQRLGRAADGVQLARWLSRQRNQGGGFGSTQVRTRQKWTYGGCEGR